MFSNTLRAMTLVILLATFLATPSLHADNWPHWRGDAGNSVSRSASPPTEWSAGQAGASNNVKWKVAIPGRGSGSPVVWDDKVFVVTAVSPSAPDAPAIGPPRVMPLQFELHCYNRADGGLVWRRVAIETTPAEGTHSTNSFASASPCTDGEHVYAHFGSQGTFCFTMDGEPVWQRDLGDMQTRAGFGEGSSPTIAGEKLLVPWDEEGPSFLYALDKRTGETIWKTERDEPTCWATPLVIEHEGEQQVVMNGQTCARAYDLETGEELWRCAGQTQRPVASAVAGDGLVFIGSGHRGSFIGAFSPGGEGDIAGTEHVRWTKNRDTPDIGSPLLSGDRLYYYKGKSGLLTCVDAATGEPHYQTKRTGLNTIYASPVAAGGFVYLTDRDGKTVVIEDSDEFKIVATNTVGETVDATPAPVDGELFIRGEQHLFCIAD